MAHTHFCAHSHLHTHLRATQTKGGFKFGGVEVFKIAAVDSLGEQAGWDNRTSIYLGAAAAAEFIADVFLCPLEVTGWNSEHK